MFSGGFDWSDLNPANYDWDISYLDDNIADAAGAVYDNVLAPIGSEVAEDAEFVYDYYANDPILLLRNFGIGAAIGAAVVLAPEALALAAANPGTVAAGLGAAAAVGAAGCKKPTVSAGPPGPETVPVFTSNLISFEEREFLSNRNFDSLASDGIENYMDDHLGTCVPNLDQAAFDFWCYGIMDGRLFYDGENWLENWLTHDDGYCSAWRVYNPDNSNPVCGESILAVDEWYSLADATTRVDLTDDNDDVWYVLREMERRVNGGVPGLAWWSGDVVQASKCFSEPAKLMRIYSDVRNKFLELFQTTFTKDFSAPTPYEQELTESMQNVSYQAVMAMKQVFETLRTRNISPEEIQSQLETISDELFSRMEAISMLIAKLHRENPTTADLMEQEIFFEIAATGAHYDIDKLQFGTDWRTMDIDHSNNSDWVTPLVHAGSLYFQAVLLYQKKYTELLAKIDAGTYDVIEGENNELFIVMNDVTGADGLPTQMSVADYANDYIWRKPGEQTETVRTDLLSEINAAVVRSKERCYGCTDEHYWARLLIEYIDKMNNGIPFDVWPREGVLDLEELRRRAHGPTTPTADECCHQEPPRFLNLTTHQCSMERTAEQECFSQAVPSFFVQESCQCDTTSAAMHCFNIETERIGGQTYGHQIFVFDAANLAGNCVPCEEPTPVTRDGVTCVARPTRREHPPIYLQQTTVEEPPPPPPVVSGGRGVTNPWQSTVNN